MVALPMVSNPHRKGAGVPTADLLLRDRWTAPFAVYSISRPQCGLTRPVTLDGHGASMGVTRFLSQSGAAWLAICLVGPPLYHCIADAGDVEARFREQLLTAGVVLECIGQAEVQDRQRNAF